MCSSQNKQPDKFQLGLQNDLHHMLIARRQALSLIGGGSAALLSACAGGGDSNTSVMPSSTSGTSASTGSSTTSTTTTSSSSSECIAYSTETNGPYPADGSNSANGAVANVLIQSGIVRSDMRSCFNGLSGTASGVDVEITITLNNVNNACAPLEGYAVYLWHCDASGYYSIYNLSAQNYLRAVGVTDAEGKVTFTTIFPGCYAGRWPHLHFEVYESLSAATHYNNRLLVSQMAMPANECSYVYSTSTEYGNSANNLTSISIASDNVFRDNSDEEIAAQTLTMSGDTNGYNATVTVGLSI